VDDRLEKEVLSTRVYDDEGGMTSQICDAPLDVNVNNNNTHRYRRHRVSRDVAKVEERAMPRDAGFW